MRSSGWRRWRRTGRTHVPKLLIVDDSALMRRHLRQVFEAAGDFEVHMARNGAEALSMAIALQPDVVTLDVNMPEMDGLTCLARLMQESPRPVVMVSSLTTDGAQVTLEALRLGAVDFIPKPGGTVSLHIDTIETVLVATVRAAASARIRRRVTRAGSSACPACAATGAGRTSRQRRPGDD